MSIFFFPLVKADEKQQLVYARAAVEELDKAREIMDYASAVPQFQKWNKQYSDATMGKSLGNVRAMHDPKHLAGKVSTINFNDAEKSVEVCIKVLDPIDWHKVEEGGYTGISMGGGYLRKWTDPATGGIRYTPRIGEISFVDSPCIPSARILEMQKSDGTTQEILLKGVPRTFAELAPPPTFNQLLQKAAFGKLIHGVAAEIGAGAKAVEHARPSGDAFVNRGKTITGQNEAERVRPSWAYSARGKRISGEVDPGHRTTIITARGKSFSSGARDKDDPLERSTPGGDMGKSLTFGVEDLDGSADTENPLLKAALKHSAAHPGFAHAQASIARREGISADRAGAILASAARKAGKGALRHNPRLKRIGGIGKQELIDRLKKDFLTEPDNSISQWQAGRNDQTYKENQFTLHQNKNLFAPYFAPPNAYGDEAQFTQPNTKQEVGAALLEMTKAANSSPSSPAQREKIRQVLSEHKAGTLRSWRGVNPDTGKPRRGPKVTDRRQAIAIALNQARRMGKSEPEPALVAALAACMPLAPDTGQVERLTKRSLLAPAQVPSFHQLTDRERAQRVAAAKARWDKEGHPDVGAHHDDLLRHARRAILGRHSKVAAVQGQIEHHWHNVADAQAAYDRMRQHTPKGHAIMMEVPHAAGLIYNPEHIGAKHFDAQGKPTRRIYMMHPDEVDDWIAKHGTNRRQVTKAEPYGVVTDLEDLFHPPSEDEERMEKLLGTLGVMGGAYLGAKIGGRVGLRSGLKAAARSGRLEEDLGGALVGERNRLTSRIRTGAVAGALGVGAAGGVVGHKLSRKPAAAA